jgi:hypothetical protein
MSRFGFVLLISAAAAAFGCRLSDPIYRKQPLRAVEPYDPSQSLIFGSVDVQDVAPGAEFATLHFRRLAPTGPHPENFVSGYVLYRVLTLRAVRDGFFVARVLPGMYEVQSVGVFPPTGGHRYFQVRAPPGSPFFYVTSPGIYDLGHLVVRQQPGSTAEPYLLEVEAPTADRAGAAERAAKLREAVKGTAWEQMR